MAEDTKKGMSRRNFLRNAAIGAAAVGAVTTAPSILGIAENVGADLPDLSGAPLVAYVKDAARGTVVVMWGSQEFEAKDRGLVAHIARYTKG